MAMSGGVSAASLAVCVTLQTPSEEDREQVDRINLTTPDGVSTDAMRRDADWAAERLLSQSLADRPTVLDRLREGPGTLDRFN